MSNPNSYPDTKPSQDSDTKKPADHGSEHQQPAGSKRETQKIPQK